MGVLTGKRRRGLGLVLAAVLAVAALAAALAVGAGPAGRGAKVPRVTLDVPAFADAGAKVSVTGRVIGVPTAARVSLQAKQGSSWADVDTARARAGRFALKAIAPASGTLALRAAVYVGRRRAAVSPVERVSLRSAAGAPAVVPDATVGGGEVLPPAPASTIEPSPTGGEEAASFSNSLWGAWIGDQLTGEEAPWDMTAVTAFEEEAGKAPSLIEFGSPFADCSQTPCAPYSFPFTPFEEIRGRGAIPFLSWSSQSLPSQTEEPDYQLSDVADGDHDTYIREFAEAAAAWGHPFFLRFDWEMNGNWFPWGTGVNGNTAADYVAAWRHVHQIFTEVGATNASWVWCPYVNPNGNLPDMATFYPGDEYVDWTCLDGYNWGPSAQPPRTWRTFSYLFGPSYKQVTETIAPGKPMLIGETSSSEEGGSKSEWIEAAFTALPREFPRIQGLIWFEKFDDGMDWPIETSTAATAAFRAGIADPRYLGNSFGSASESPIPAP